MAATATAPRSRGSATARKPKPKPRSAPRSARSGAALKRRRGITPAAGFMLPAAAVGRTAVAVGGLADSGFVVRLTRSRAWIGVVAALLVGIVALNVYSLSMSASGSKVAGRAETLARENSALRAQLTERLSNERIQGLAGRLGLMTPAPDAIRYLRADDANARTAAKRLLDGGLASSGATVPPVDEVAPAPVAPAPVEPTAIAPATVAPATDPATAAPVTPATTAPPATP